MSISAPCVIIDPSGDIWLFSDRAKNVHASFSHLFLLSLSASILGRTQKETWMSKDVFLSFHDNIYSDVKISGLLGFRFSLPIVIRGLKSESFAVDVLGFARGDFSALIVLLYGLPVSI